MAYGWNGPDPTEASDADDYELGTRYRANADVTLLKARVWTGPGELNIANRKARVWSTAGAQLGIASLPTDLAEGWSTHAYDSPIEITSGTTFVVSFSTGGNEGAAAGALGSDVPSADGLLTALASSNPPGNGVYNLSPGMFPTTGSGTSAFYGADVEYTAGIGGNTAPRITAFTVTAAGATATATVVAEDDETLTGATYRFQWGDGSSDTITTHPTSSAAHTYTLPGSYAVLVTVTDADGASDVDAAPVTVTVADPSVVDLTQARVEQILSGVVDHALRSGWFEAVNGHEPHATPGHGLTVAVWVDAIQPVTSSGLNVTSARLGLMVRIYANGDQEPLDAIDPAVTAATSVLLREYQGDFTLGGLVRHVDVFGVEGPQLGAQAGWLAMDGGRMRVMTIVLPLVVNDLWEQVP